MHSLILLCFALVAAVYADDVKFKDCGSKAGTIVSVDITPCPQFPCALKRGTNATTTVVFTSKTQSETATAKVYGVIANVPVPFPVPNSDGCKTGVTCPVENGVKYTYKNSIFVSKLYPKVQVVVEWSLVDDKGENIFCFAVPAQVS
ncbi:NPC intracellular cholesterol transporter 2-like [Lineus longissimus]|uniref:NPC intracellular cholesterol transporter 2-like n=1 Tax=Lineus longissimus TaxID=88925 RepID=UPI002B4D909E